MNKKWISSLFLLGSVATSTFAESESNGYLMLGGVYQNIISDDIPDDVKSGFGVQAGGVYKGEKMGLGATYAIARHDEFDISSPQIEAHFFLQGRDEEYTSLYLGAGNFSVDGSDGSSFYSLGYRKSYKGIYLDINYKKPEGDGMLSISAGASF